MHEYEWCPMAITGNAEQFIKELDALGSAQGEYKDVSMGKSLHLPKS